MGVCTGEGGGTGEKMTDKRVTLLPMRAANYQDRSCIEGDFGN